MNFTRRDIQWAVDEHVLSAEQAKAFEAALARRQENRPQFTLGHTVYFFGGLIVLSAMSWFMVRAWENLGGGGIFLAALTYAALFAGLGRALWNRPTLKIPGGILFTAAVSLTPLAVYGLQRYLGFWPAGHPGVYVDFHTWIRGGWFLMETATVLVGLVTLRFVRFPFLTFPVAVALWYLSMDLTPILTGAPHFTWEMRKLVSMIFGALMLLGSYVVDRRAKEDYAFWGYLFGMLAFWGGLTMMDSTSELGKLGYCALNVALIFVSVFLRRRVFIVFGALGVFLYLGHLAHEVFANSLLFPVALSGVGLLVIFGGVAYQKHRARLETWMMVSLPESVRRLRPVER